LQFFRGHLAGQLSSLSRHSVSTFVVQRLFVRLATHITSSSSSSASSASSSSKSKSSVASTPKVEPTPAELTELIQEVVEEMKPLLSSLLGSF
jgi:guanyl-specific ribonuclease Sa